MDSLTNTSEHLTQYCKATQPIPKPNYTTKPFEAYHRQIRKVSKTNGAFPNEMALLKLAYLATQDIQKKWTVPLHNWSLTVQQLYIRFEDRVKLDLKV